MTLVREIQQTNLCYQTQRHVGQSGWTLQCDCCSNYETKFKYTFLILKGPLLVMKLLSNCSKRKRKQRYYSGKSKQRQLHIDYF